MASLEGSHEGVGLGIGLATPTKRNGTNETTTNPERDGFHLLNAREYEQIYLVRWASEGFVKVGFSCDGKRWRSFTRRGGRLLGIASFPLSEFSGASRAEYLLHIGLPKYLPRAFGHRSEAAHYLGHNGAGWTECYVDDGSLALPMFTLAAEVVRSGDESAYWQVREHWEKPLAARLVSARAASTSRTEGRGRSGGEPGRMRSTVIYGKTTSTP